MGIVVGIDASRNRSGGAIAHLIGILKGADPTAFGVHQVHVWAYRSLVDALPNYSWLVKHSPVELEKALPRQAWWQYLELPRAARRCGCSVVLNTDAGSLCPFQPSVTMSRDLLSYEPGEMERFGFSPAWLRLWLLRHIQSRSLRKASGVIFLTKYAAEIIQRTTGPLRRSAVIPHGVGEGFRQLRSEKPWPLNTEGDIRCLYVSNISLYKHQWHVVRAIAGLRKKGYRLHLSLVGGGEEAAKRRLARELAALDPCHEFVHVTGPARHDAIPGALTTADLFIFASSCENMPNSLVEAMASGLPVACSNRGPMPEVLEDGGVYFDPEDPDSIAEAVEKLITDDALRMRIQRRAPELAAKYSWPRCSAETFKFLVECANTTVDDGLQTDQTARG